MAGKMQFRDEEVVELEHSPTLSSRSNERIPEFEEIEFNRPLISMSKKRLYIVVVAAALVVILLSIMTVLIAIANHTHQHPEKAKDPTVILISIDGFRYDYFDRYPNAIPTLASLRKSGVFAPLRPQFPSKTFPNHYTLVTGLYPESHGIVGNRMYDPVFNATFRVGDRDSMRDGRWWGGEPIWITSVKQNVLSAVCFWPGSEATIQGSMATYTEPYNQEMPYSQRVDKVLSWLDEPEERRPRFLAVYFEAVDTVGHSNGPDSSEIPIAMTRVDNAIQSLLEGLEQRKIREHIDIIVVSDHGMTSVNTDRVSFFEDYISPDDINLIDYSPLLSIIPKNMSQLEDIYQQLKKVPHMTTYKKEEMPPYWHYTNNRRISPLLGVVDEGWEVMTHASYNSIKNTFPGGDHGYDNRLVSMQAMLLGQGPHFKEDYQSQLFDNIHLYPLLCNLLGLQAAPNNGSLDAIQHLLK